MDFLIPRGLLETLSGTDEPKFANLGDTYDNKTTVQFLKQFTYNSSRLEGAVTSFAATEEILASDDYSDKNKILVHNHKKAIDWFVKCVRNSEYGFEESMNSGSNPIKELHTMLMEGLLSDDSEGEVRQSEVIITGSSYVPLTDEEDLELYLNQIAIKSGEISNEFEKAFFLLVHISELQAFRDGNKRTARLMSNYPLLAEGRIPHAFAEISEDDYLKAVVFYYETGVVRPLVLLWADSYFSGQKHFRALEDNYESANLAKVELSEDRKEAVRLIIKTSEDLEHVIERVWNKSRFNRKYEKSIFTAQVKTALDKVTRTQAGGMLYDVTEHEIREFSKKWQDM